MFTKCHIVFFTFICDLLHCSDQLRKSLFHRGWWIYFVTKPDNGTNREIALLHGREPIEFHNPIITFKMFMFIIIIGLHIIWNMSWVYKHVTQPSTMWSIPCSTIMNDILLRNVYACENDHNLMFTHVPLQCPFTCATRYFGEWEFHHISDVGKALVPYAPSSITLKGWLVHMGEWNKGYLFHTSYNNGLHNLGFYETFFLLFQCACNGVQWLF
jgi:hypothetical protein